MDKSINIEVLLKAAEYIEQTNKGVTPNSFEFFSQSNYGNTNKRHFNSIISSDCVPHSSESDELSVKILNNSINSLKQQENQHDRSISLDSLKLKYAKTNEHKQRDEFEDQKININRNKTTHNILEKNRRAHLKECFENLQNELPLYKDKKVTNLLILKQTCKFLEQSKKKENESTNEIKRLLAQNIALIEHLTKLKANFSNDYLLDFDIWIKENTNKLKEIKMLNYIANYDSSSDSNSMPSNANYDEENSRKNFDSFESESSEFDSEYNENSKSN